MADEQTLPKVERCRPSLKRRLALWALVIGFFFQCWLTARELLHPERPADARARRRCAGNLHDIGVALQLYRRDTGHYPLDSGEVPSGARWYGGKEAGQGGWGLGALYPNYVASLPAFHCPADGWDDPDGPANTYNSYEVADPGKAAPDDRKYRRAWSLTDGKPDPAQRRQLYWPDAPGDTVVAWCHLHRPGPGKPRGPAAPDNVLLADGSVCTAPASRSGHGFSR